MGSVGSYLESKTRRKGKNGSMLSTQLLKKAKSKIESSKRTELVDKKSSKSKLLYSSKSKLSKSYKRS